MLNFVQYEKFNLIGSYTLTLKNIYFSSSYSSEYTSPCFVYTEEEDGFLFHFLENIV